MNIFLKNPQDPRVIKALQLLLGTFPGEEFVPNIECLLPRVETSIVTIKNQNYFVITMKGLVHPAGNNSMSDYINIIFETNVSRKYFYIKLPLGFTPVSVVPFIFETLYFMEFFKSSPAA